MILCAVSGARCCRCLCLPCVGRVPCLDFFVEEEARLRRLIQQEEELASQQTLAMAFVTFMNINHARLFLRDHKSSVLNWKRRCQQSSLAMEPRRWRVWFAPPPGDIIWENMSNRQG